MAEWLISHPLVDPLIILKQTPDTIIQFIHRYPIETHTVVSVSMREQYHEYQI